MGTVVKVWSDEEVSELRSGHWAAMLDAQEGGTVAYLRFESQWDRAEWVCAHRALRIVFPAHSVPLSLLLDRQAWSEKVVNLSAKRKAKVLFANH
jgi:hypothetical protein